MISEDKMSDTKQKSIAEKIFEGESAKGILLDTLLELEVPFESISYDGYDCSIEMYETAPTYRLSIEVQKLLHRAGFETVYVNHKDGWETHYKFKPHSEFELSEGWRVSYPHKRTDGTKDILVEHFPIYWPVEWLATGYVRVVNNENC